jgi:hypothetical protein
MLSALKAEFSPPSDTEQTNIQKLSEALSMRAAVMQQLSLTYNALNSLTSYDASKETETALAGLTGAINSYAKMIDPNSKAISETGGIVIGEVGKGVIGQIQINRIKKASELIRPRLEQFLDLIEQEKQIYMNIQQVLLGTASRTAVALYRSGIGSPHPIFKELVGDMGFEYKPEEKQLTSLSAEQREKLQKGIELVARRKIANSIRQEQSIYINMIEGMANLITQHRKLEEGESLDLSGITAMTIRFREILDRINTIHQKVN